jgi:hypothetical protein
MSFQIGQTPPVLFCVFNRLDYAKQTFEKIRKAKPKQLFVAADGPRANKKDDAALCQETRDWIVKNVDWDCDLKLLFAGRNMGCSPAMKSAIDWFFSNVEEGIILEEDCVVSDCFFDFCGELLDKYRNNQEVMLITGHGVLKRGDRSSDYVFCKGVFNEFAIATWRRAWQKNDFHLGKWPEFKQKEIFNFHHDKEVVDFFFQDIERNYNEAYCWGGNWMHNIIMNNGVYISPVGNLVKNVGVIGVHDAGGISELLNNEAVEFDIKNLKHPAKIEVDEDLFNQQLVIEKKRRSSCKEVGVSFKKLKKQKLIKRIRYLILTIVIWEAAKFLANNWL